MNKVLKVLVPLFVLLFSTACVKMRHRGIKHRGGFSCATAAKDFVNTASVIKSFKIVGYKTADPNPRFFVNSNLSAAKITTSRTR